MKQVQQRIDDFFGTLPERHYQKGETFIQAGTKPMVFYIVEGTVAQYDTSSNGNKLIVNIYKTGSFLPLPSVLNDIPTEFAYEANDDLIVRVATRTQIVDFLESSPDVVLDTLKRVSRGTDGLLARLASVMEGNAEGRILQELEIMIARFGNNDGVSVTEVDLAAQTGLARETVSRTLKKLRTKGKIVRENGFTKIN